MKIISTEEMDRVAPGKRQCNWPYAEWETLEPGQAVEIKLNGQSPRVCQSSLLAGLKLRESALRVRVAMKAKRAFVYRPSPTAEEGNP